MEEEITLKVNDVTLVGHYDLLIEADDGQSVVIDIKTTISREEYLPKQPHLTQLMAYQGVLGGIRGGILYVNRNNFQLSYFPQEFKKEESIITI